MVEVQLFKTEEDLRWQLSQLLSFTIDDEIEAQRKEVTFPKSRS